MRVTVLALSLGVAAFTSCRAPLESIAPAEAYRPAVASIEAFLRGEMESKAIPGVAIALVDGEQTVFAQGYGLADPQKQMPATAATLFRVGSVSKLFVAMALMREVERGRIDLDSPVQEYLPSFQPQNPFSRPITLREILCHRSGLVREPPVGHYFDDREPTVAETVESLNSTTLVYEPFTRTKYSNAALTVAGEVLAKVRGQSFERSIESDLFRPLRIRQARWRYAGSSSAEVAGGEMWGLDGRRFVAPTFDLGTLPAGNLYISVVELAELMKSLLEGASRPLVRPETMAEMRKPQCAAAGESAPFGIGFRLDTFGEEPVIRHGGAVYGFSTEFMALPRARLGAIVVGNADSINTVTTRIAHHALACMLACRNQSPLPQPETTLPLERDTRRKVAGRYSDGKETIELIDRGDRLILSRREQWGEVRGLPAPADASPGAALLCTDDRLSFGTKLLALDDSITLEGRTFTRTAFPALAGIGSSSGPLSDPETVAEGGVTSPPLPLDLSASLAGLSSVAPDDCPERWRGLIGEYGWDHNVLFIHERDGVLRALIEWFDDYPLTEITSDQFAFPDYGLYHGEQLLFQRDETACARRVLAASVRFERRETGGRDGTTFQIEPQQPIEALRAQALQSSPPAEAGEFRAPDLVDLAALDPTIKLDIRYASSNNFLGAVLYEEPRAFMQRPAAEALARVHRSLRPLGYGLLVHDAYRPWFVTRMFWDATPEKWKHFVADPAKGSRHNRGCAVDLTLYELQSGNVVEMVGGYDEFSERSYPDYIGGTSVQRWHRDLLRRMMENEGFTVYEFEWWHFDYQHWRKYPIQNLPFSALSQ